MSIQAKQCPSCWDILLPVHRMDGSDVLHICPCGVMSIDGEEWMDFKSIIVRVNGEITVIKPAGDTSEGDI